MSTVSRLRRGLRVEDELGLAEVVAALLPGDLRDEARLRRQRLELLAPQELLAGAPDGDLGRCTENPLGEKYLCGAERRLEGEGTGPKES